jgi:xanthine dehydrogenase accessory factor
MNAADELEPLLTALRDVQSGGRRAALITLTRTRGATFRRVGTRMLVYEDGATVCELSGGCPQRDIVAHAMQAMASGRARLVRYDEASGLDVLMEMGCGGELEVLVQPLDASSELAGMDALARCLRQRREGMLATVFAHDGEVVAPRQAVWCGGELVHDGFADEALHTALQGQLPTPPERPVSRVVTTVDGRFDVLVERVLPTPALVVIGSSTAAQALLPLAGALGWSATLVDFDAERLHAVPLPAHARAVCAQPAGLVAAVQPDAATSVVVMTHNLHKDADYLAALRGVPLAYLGLLGARGRVRRVIGLAGATDMDIHGPVGLDIGSESPSEIALSIIAEILAATRGRPGGPLRALPGAAP